MVARKAATKRKAKAKPKKPTGRPTKYPGDEKACALAMKAGEEGGGKHTIACAIGISHKVLLEWLNVDHNCYKGELFRKAVDKALSISADLFLIKVEGHMVEEPGEAKINTGVMNFIALHKHGMVPKTQIENQGGLHVHVEKDDADL